MELKAYPIMLENYRKAGRPGARVVFKTEKGATARVFAPFDPYFYVVPEGDAEAAARRCEKLSAAQRGQNVSTKAASVVKVKEGIVERKAIRVSCHAPEHVPALAREAEAIGRVFERDVPFTKRFAIDTGLIPNDEHSFTIKDGELAAARHVAASIVVPNLRVMAFDIETYNPGGASNAAKDPVLMISYATKQGSRVLTWGKKTKRQFVESFRDERQMIETFLERVMKEKVDVLSGYNSDEYDLPYLAERCKRLRVPFNIGRDKRKVVFKRIGLRSRARISGRIHFDAYNTVALLNLVGANKFSRLTLETVYAELLDKKKPGMNKAEIYKAWDAGGALLDELFDYSQGDAIACLEITDYVMPLAMQLSRVTGLPLFDASRASASEMVEALLMRHAKARGELVPNKPEYGAVQERMANPIAGAFVKVPDPGIYDGIVVFDFRSLYPSIVTSHNIDPYTITHEAKADCFESPTGARFVKKPKGIVPQTLETVLDERIATKQAMKTAKTEAEKQGLNGRQIALKILANSFYGYLAYARSRYYSREAGESTTAWARQYIHETIETAEKAGFKVLYSDTDSTFLLLGEKKMADALAFQASVNKTLPGRMELELEGFYPRGIFVSKKQEAAGAKKKYALLSDKGDIKIRGFELVRRDWSAIARDTQRQALEILLKEGDVAKVKELVAKKVDELRRGKVPLSQLSIRTRLTKKASNYDIVSPEVAAVRKAHGTAGRSARAAEEGMVEYVITKRGKTISDKAQLTELTEEGDYDAEYYVNNQLLPSVMKLLGSLGASEDDLKAKGRQRGLADFG